MTKEQIEAVFERVRTWPEDWQADAISMLLALEKDYEDPYVPTDEERAGIEAGLAQAERGEFASDEEIAAVFRRGR
jgi:hypothetical protein